MATRVIIETKAVGKLSPTGYKKLLKEHGSPSGVAKALGVSPSTVASWGSRLRQLQEQSKG